MTYRLPRHRLARGEIARLGSGPEFLLAVQLERAGIDFLREHPFASRIGRKWRADFWILGIEPTRQTDILVEIDGGGYVAGRHSRGAGIEADCEKTTAAAILGYRVIRATPKQVEDGRCLEWIRAALGMEVAA